MCGLIDIDKSISIEQQSNREREREKELKNKYILKVIRRNTFER